MKKINWNDIVMVKLTDLGRDIYFHQYDDLIAHGLKISPSYPDQDIHGFSKFQLWYFMQIYGKYIGMMLPNIVTDCNFYIYDDSIDDVEVENDQNITTKKKTNKS